MCILLPLDALAQEPPGTFVNECRDRHFWMKTKRSFLTGGNFRFDIIDNDGIHALDDRYAASCGFTYSFNIPGDLIFRASFLACHVSSKNDAEFGLRFRFARIDQFGRETYYPFSMRCSTAQAWYPREIAQEAFMSVWQVVFHKTGQPAKPMDPSLAHSRGYRINSTSTRILFRSPLDLHTNLHSLWGGGWLPEDTLAEPRLYPSDRALLSLQSRVINNQYNRLYAIDLYLEHQWAADQWEATQHRSFKPVHTLFIAETPFVINNTIPEEKVFTVTLGIFNPDVELKNLTINGVPLTLPEAVNQGIVVTEVQHPNGTKSFVLKVPFTHPLIPQKYVGDGVREFTLNINYTLNILPENEPYFHPATIVCRVKDVILPVIKGSCTENSIVFEGTHGNMDYFWVVYIGKHQLTSELAANRGYIFTNLTKFIVEVPVFSVGCICEDISLRGVSVRVELTLRSAATLEVVLSSIQRCQFPTKQLLGKTPQRLTIRCRYFLNDTVKLLAERKAVPVPYSGKEGLGSLEFNPYSQGSGGSLKFRDVLNLTARIARDVSYSQFYSAFPVSQSVLEPLFLEVELLHPQNLSDQLILQDCWATETPELDASPQWDLVTDSCLTSGDSYKTQFHPVSASALTKTPHHLQRLEVQAHSAEDRALWKQVYLHCLAVVCDSEKAVACNKTCITGVKRSGRQGVAGLSCTGDGMHLIPGTLQNLATTLLTNSCAFKLEPFKAD
ncbi:UNVERIFIED_CONTAM: hypothetical protein FKN15_021435 [Acipenser sinensis]